MEARILVRTIYRNRFRARQLRNKSLSIVSKKSIDITLPFDTACVLSSLIRGAVGGDFTSNEARIALDKLLEELDERGVPIGEFDCFFVAHVELSRKEAPFRRARKRGDT